MSNKLKKISSSVWEWFVKDGIPLIIVWVWTVSAVICANLITGCAQLSEMFPEATKEASTVAPELRDVTDRKAAETIKKGKGEAVEKVEKL